MTVARADRVELQSVDATSGLVWEQDLAHPHTLLSAGDTPQTVQAPFRTGEVPARRNADGSIDLILGGRVWPIVRADGRVAWLRNDAYELDASGVTWAFLAAPPDLHVRTPWQLRIATPSDNVREAKVAIRREPVDGFLFLALGIGAAAGATALFDDAGQNLSRGTSPFEIGLAAVDAVAAALAIGYGLFVLLRHPHDEFLVRAH